MGPLCGSKLDHHGHAADPVCLSNNPPIDVPRPREEGKPTIKSRGPGVSAVTQWVDLTSQEARADQAGRQGPGLQPRLLLPSQCAPPAESGFLHLHSEKVGLVCGLVSSPDFVPGQRA